VGHKAAGEEKGEGNKEREARKGGRGGGITRCFAGS